MKVNLDKFYTKSWIAKKCITSVGDLKKFDNIIEPSAGSGSFSNLIPNCLAYDIEPENENIIKQDYFKLDTSIFKGKTLVIGNPPFGKRSSLAKAFIKKSVLYADTIAFILPDTFKKYQMQKVFPEDWKLNKIIDLKGACFEANGEDYFVPCSFFIWSKKGVDLRAKKPIQPKEFIFLPRNSKDADFCINGNNGKIKKLSEITNSKAEHYIKVTNRKDVDKIKKIFKKLPLEFNSSVNGKNAWVGQSEIIDAFNKLIESDNVPK